MELKRTDIVIKPNNARVLVRPFEFTDTQRAFRIVARIMSLPDADVDRLIADLFTEFHGRHQKARQFILHRFDYARQFLLTDAPVSENRQLLIGAYFTQEYALESAALFNPSMVWHPDQSNVPAGAKRFILSLRATGEGHVSSITFRSGIVDRDCKIVLDPNPRFVTTPDMETNTLYEKGLFQRKLVELGFANGFVEQVMALLDDSFTFDQLKSAVSTVRRQYRMRTNEFDTVANAMTALAKSNYEFTFAPELSLAERAIFPYSPSQMNGIEDARFVEFHDDDGSVRYYATHTAFDGRVNAARTARDRRFHAIPDQHAQRSRDTQQRHGAISAEDRRLLRHAFAAGWREYLRHVLGHASFLVHEAAHRQADLPVGVRTARQLRFADRDGGWLAGTDARRRADAEILDGGILARLERSDARHRPARGAAVSAERK